MNVNKIRFILLVGVFASCSIASFGVTSQVPLKQAKGRLKAIARGYMIENQKNTNPFELHQNWRFIKKDVYATLTQKSCLDKHNQRVVDENVMPEMTSRVFQKLVELKTRAASEKGTRFRPSPNLITMKATETLVRERLRKHGIILKDRPIVFEGIMQELKKYTEENNRINRKLVKIIADQMIGKFQQNKLSVQTTTPKSYLLEFIAGWQERFAKQIKKQDWNAVQ